MSTSLRRNDHQDAQATGRAYLSLAIAPCTHRTLRTKPQHDVRVGLNECGQIQTALLAEITEAAIVEFVQCPFTSLIGHIDFDPACRVELSDEEHSSVKAAAVGKGISTEDYILQCLSLPARPRRP